MLYYVRILDADDHMFYRYQERRNKYYEELNQLRKKEKIFAISIVLTIIIISFIIGFVLDAILY